METELINVLSGFKWLTQMGEGAASEQQALSINEM